MEIDYDYVTTYEKPILFTVPGSPHNKPHKASRKRGAGYTKSRKCARNGKSSSRR